MNIIMALDVVLNFLTAIDDGSKQLIWSQAEVAKAYSKSWLLVDIIGAVPITTILAIDEGRQAYLRLLQLFTLTVAIRLVRYFLKYRREIHYNLHALRVFEFIVCAIAFAHFDACIDFYLQESHAFPAEGTSARRVAQILVE